MPKYSSIIHTNFTRKSDRNDRHFHGCEEKFYGNLYIDRGLFFRRTILP